MAGVAVVHRLAAAAIAVFVTTSTVWGMAGLGYPTSNPVLISAKHACPGS